MFILTRNREGKGKARPFAYGYPSIGGGTGLESLFLPPFWLPRLQLLPSAHEGTRAHLSLLPLQQVRQEEEEAAGSTDLPNLLPFHSVFLLSPPSFRVCPPPVLRISPA